MNVAGVRVAGLPAYVCHIAHPDPQSLFLLSDKVARLPQQRQRQKRLNIVAIEPSRRAPCQCIAVSHPSRLYVTNQDVVTHNTAFAINIAEHVALNEGLPVAVFSMEMGASQLAVRIVGSIGRVNQGHLRTGKLTDDEWPRLTEAIERLRTVSLHIDETPGLTPSELRANARRLARQCGKLGLIVVDYLQLMSGSSSDGDNRATELGEISRGLKMLAKELNCPVIALSQLNRSVEQRTDKRPMMSDLRESGAIEQDADIIMFIYRDEYYTKDACKEPGVAEIIIGKQRNGPTGTVKLAFLNALTRFESLAGGYGDF
jgi:replicative DNA helicase